MFSLPTKTYAATIFDCDGTLVDSMPLHYRGFLHAFAELGYAVNFAEDDFYNWGGVPLAGVVRRLNEQQGLAMDPTAVEPLKNAFVHQHHHEVQAVDPVVAYARSQKALGQPVGVASGGHRGEVLRSLEVIGMAKFFPVIVTRDDVTNGKPHPETYLQAAKRLGAKARDCLVFEDAESGRQAAIAAGMDVVMVDTRAKA